MGYSELIQRLFEKMAFFLVDPLSTSTTPGWGELLGSRAFL